MISCNILGGLGNIMFPVATAFSLAKDNNDIAVFPNANEHLNELNKDKGFRSDIYWALEYKNIFKGFNFESNYSDINNCVNVPFHYVKIRYEPNLKIQGYFQSEKYFVHNKNLILDTFEPTNMILNIINDKYFDLLNNNETVAVHVRRGERINLENYHPIPKIEYFNDAISIMKKNIKNPLFLIFSDDVNWCKTNFKEKNQLIIEGNRDYIDMFLMSLCHHNIISNSSFSWWSAWLNKNSNKIVISQNHKYWLGVEYKNIITSDLIPDDWIQI